MQQIICIQVGQCGLQIGYALWELLTCEHYVSEDGSPRNSDIEHNDILFYICENGKHVPRTLFIDLEPTVVDEIKSGSFRRLFHPDQLISGPEDASNNFARGFYSSGRLMKEVSENQIRKEVEKCCNVQAMYLFRSLGGGTGSGMSSTILESLGEYCKIPKLEVPIHPSPYLCSATVEPYNCILSEHFCIDDIDISLLMDNEALYEIITGEIKILQPTFHNLNRILAQVLSSITSSTRYKNDLYNDFTIMTNLVPYPRIHFPLVSYAPFGNFQKLSKDVVSVSEITKSLFWSTNQLLKCDPTFGKFMSCSLLYRGVISPSEIYEALAEIKSGNNVNFVDWCPTGFKIGIVHKAPQIVPDSNIGVTNRNVIMLSNNSSISSVWLRLSQKFHKLYSKRSFIHWFVAEGLEESEFCESLYNIATLAKDYEEVSMDTKFINSSNIDESKDYVEERDIKVSMDYDTGNTEMKVYQNKEESYVRDETTEKQRNESNENVSNISSENRRFKELQLENYNTIKKNNIIKIIKNFKTIKEIRNVSIIINSENSSEKQIENETIRDANLYKINFIKKCTNKNGNLKNEINKREERTLTLMNRLSEIIGKI